MHQAQSFYSIKGKRQNLLWLRLQSATWPFCPSAPVSRIVWDARLNPTADYDWAGKDRTGQAAAASRFLLSSIRTPRDWARGMDGVSCIYARLIWLGFHRDAVEKTTFACSASVPHGALRASHCHSTRPFGTRDAFRGGVSSLCRPVTNCCTIHRPATSLSPHCYFTATQTVADCGKCMLNV